ncbi:MAG: peptide ABC transporter substrate-binding protein, partial [Candidatus Marsarchaeota archaeon]|nr:peptide ABC transporter substrate-binding protein [Candidatus Marsarchaeota archaeon]
MFVTGGGNNQTGWSNKQYDDLIAKATQTTDNTKRMNLLQQAEKILVVDELPIAPIYYYTNNNLVKPYVKGMTWNLQDIHLLKNVSVNAH